MMPHPLLEFQNVTVMRGVKRALDSLTFSIAQGEHVAILGPNGSGKSTLIKAITRECYPRAGIGAPHPGPGPLERFRPARAARHRFERSGTDLRARYHGPRSGALGFFSSIGLQPYHEVTPEMEKKAGEVLDLLEVPHLADRWMDEVSSGEARRILIGRALVHDPQALVLDEPTTSLDLRATWEVHEILRKLARSGITIIMVTHHLPDLIPEIGRAILLKQGRVFHDGPRARGAEPCKCWPAFRYAGRGIFGGIIFAMRLFFSLSARRRLLIAGWLYAQPAGDPLIEGFRLVEVASVADAMEQLYGQRGYMSHDMRPLFKTKFAGPAVTVMMKKVEHKEGSSVSKACWMRSMPPPPGSVYVMVPRRRAGYSRDRRADGDGDEVSRPGGRGSRCGVRDLPQINRLQFPVFSRAIVPSTSVNHYKFWEPICRLCARACG